MTRIIMSYEDALRMAPANRPLGLCMNYGKIYPKWVEWRPPTIIGFHGMWVDIEDPTPSMRLEEAKDWLAIAEESHHDE